MKKIIKQVTQNVEEIVCDICESRDVPISWDWTTSCPYDDCNNDWGTAHFCSVKCFIEGIKRSGLGVNQDEDFSRQQFTLTMHGTGVSELTVFMALLAKTASL